MKPRLHTLIREFILLAAFLLLPSLGLGQADHQSVLKSPNLSFDEVFDIALQHAPELMASSSRQEQAREYSKLGDSLFANRPSWQLSYIDDNTIDAIGLREIETGLQFSLWRPGEKRQANALGHSYGELYSAWEGYLELEIAGRVRSVLADMQRAEALLALEQESAVNAENLVQLTTRMFESGETAQLDVMQAQSLLLEQRRAELRAAAAVVDAEREYTTLTGLELRPAQYYSESLSTLEDIDPKHPYLVYLQANIDVATSNVDRTRSIAKGNPQVTFGVRRERGSRLQPYNDSLSLSFNVPFGKSAAVSTQVAAARREKADIEVERQRAHIELNRQLHEAEHELFLTSQEQTLSREHAAISERRRVMATTAYELGETDLLQVVISLQQAHDSQKALQGLILKEQELITEYNQILGLLP